MLLSFHCDKSLLGNTTSYCSLYEGSLNSYLHKHIKSPTLKGHEGHFVSPITRGIAVPQNSFFLLGLLTSEIYFKQGLKCFYFSSLGFSSASVLQDLFLFVTGCWIFVQLAHHFLSVVLGTLHHGAKCSTASGGTEVIDVPQQAHTLITTISDHFMGNFITLRSNLEIFLLIRKTQYSSMLSGFSEQ